MRFYYFDFSLLDPTRLLKNLGKSFSGGRPGGGGCVGDRGGREQDFWVPEDVVRDKEWGRTGDDGGHSGGWETWSGSGTWWGAEKQGARVTSILFDLELIICK